MRESSKFVVFLGFEAFYLGVCVCVVSASKILLFKLYLKWKTYYLTFRKVKHMTEQMDIIRLKVEGQVRHSDHRIIKKVTKEKKVVIDSSECHNFRGFLQANFD